MRETFIDEEFRLIRSGSAYTTWNSQTTLGEGSPGNLISSDPTISSVTPAPHADACTVGSNLVRPEKFFADQGSSTNTPAGSVYNDFIPNLATGGIGGGSYDPTLTVGTQPDYSGFNSTGTYTRLFEAITNPLLVIASFELTFTGSFPGGNALAALINNDMLMYIRKKDANSGSNFGYGAIPHSLHGANSFGSPDPYTDPPTATDGAGSACRTGSSSGNFLTGSFGSSAQCEDGFFVEIHIKNADVRIDSIVCNLIFANGSSENG